MITFTPAFLKQLWLTLGASLAFLIIGLVRGYSSSAIPSMERINPEILLEGNSQLKSWIGAIAPSGAITGSLFSGQLMQRLGRKRTLMMASPLWVAGWLILGFAKYYPLVLVGRFICGVCVGFVLAPVQVYVSECCDPEIRGRLGSLPTLSMSLGILMSYIAGSWLDWRYLAGFSAVFSAALFVMLLPLPESPTWLEGHGADSSGSIKWLHLSARATAVVKDEEEEKQEKAEEPALPSLFTRKVFFSMAVVKPLVVGFALLFFQQFSGIDAVIFFTVEIFQSAASSRSCIVWLLGQYGQVFISPLPCCLVEIHYEAGELKQEKQGPALPSLFTRKVFFSMAVVKPLVVGFALLFFQQFSGIDAVIFFTVEIFQSAGKIFFIESMDNSYILLDQYLATLIAWSSIVKVLGHLDKIEERQMSVLPRLFTRKVFFSMAVVKPLVVGFALLFFQQFSGIDAVIFFTVEIFQSAGTIADYLLATRLPREGLPLVVISPYVGAGELKLQKQGPALPSLFTRKVFFSMAVLKPLVVGFALLFFRQFSGIDAVIFFTVEIFQSAVKVLGHLSKRESKPLFALYRNHTNHCRRNPTSICFLGTFQHHPKVRLEIPRLPREGLSPRVISPSHSPEKQGSALPSLFTRKVFFSMAVVKPLVVGFALLFFQQFSGIDAVIFFTVEIFQSAGKVSHCLLNTAITQTINGETLLHSDFSALSNTILESVKILPDCPGKVCAPGGNFSITFSGKEKQESVLPSLFTRKVFFSMAVVKPLVVGFALLFFQQFSGIDAVIFFTVEIFQSAVSVLPSLFTRKVFFSMAVVKPLVVGFALLFFQQFSGIDAVIFFTVEIFQSAVLPSLFTRKVFFSMAVVKPLVVGFALLFFQQFSGIDAVIFFTVEIFQSAGKNYFFIGSMDNN
ncbi:sugar transporter domain-containing protein [Phthorimaea operculella]|nr:sugar transporter domain-containing protein [Phthorimaea operculella]